MLKITNFSKTYKGGAKAVNQLNLQVQPGDIFGFIGHNGAGKSTTIKAVVGVLDFESGEILIQGHSIKEEPLICKRLMAYMPDNPDLYEHLTGIQYLNFIADIFAIPAETRQKTIEKNAELFEITGNLGDLISSYSHGMKQKLAIVAAVIHSPRLLVLDEPFVGLDPRASATLKQLMRNLCGEGCAIFFSTHVLDVAEKLCNKIAIINKGNLVFVGTMDALLSMDEGKSLEEIYLDLVSLNS